LRFRVQNQELFNAMGGTILVSGSLVAEPDPIEGVERTIRNWKTKMQNITLHGTQ
jgi:hypothetical protein